MLEKARKIFGYEREEHELARVLSGGRVFPTWIFYGSSGVGKASIAIKFAKCLLADVVPGDGTLDIDDDNGIHKLVDQRIHPDFFVLEQTDGSISVDDSRKLLLRVRKTPALAKRRVVLLEDSSGFNKNVYNSLLKMLEEPPRDTVIIMICDNIGTVPKTLLSRASKIYFRPLDEASVKRVLDETGVPNSTKLAKLSGGSVGYALRLNEHDGIEIYENILKGFYHDGSMYQKTLKHIIDNRLCEKFDIVKFSILQILKVYVDILSGTADERFEEEIKILKPTADIHREYPGREIKKVQEIVYMTGLCDYLILDRNAVIVDVFERFFKNRR
jgi:hypothetical protein